MEAIQIKLNPSQAKAYLSNSVEDLYISGLGGGKSFYLGLRSYEYSMIKGSIGFLGAPVFDTVKNSTFPQVVEAWEKMGINDGIHYVVNRMPPAAWGVKPYSRLSNTKIVTFRWGSYLLVDSLENYNKHRGTQFDYVLIDELRDVRHLAYSTMRGRLRGKAFKERSKKHAKRIEVLEENFLENIIDEQEYLNEVAKLTGYKMISVTTPPENPDFVEELSQRPGVYAVFGRSDDNKANLPAGYIQGLRSAYDPITAARELDAQLIRNVENLFANTFDRDKHISSEAVYHKEEPLCISFDFNLDPFVCVIAQHGYDKGKQWIHVIDEIYLTKEDHDRTRTYVQNICDKIRQKYPQDFYLITGDVSGGHGELGRRLDYNAYSEIQRELHLTESQIMLPSVNPLIRRSRTLLCSMLANHKHLFINPKCKELIKDLEIVQTDKEGKIVKDKDSKRTHILDAFRYYLNIHHSDFIPDHNR